MDLFRNLGLTLRLVRELRLLDQAELARLAGIGKSQISKYENGKELPKLDSLGRILNTLQLKPSDFFYIQNLIDQQAGRIALDPVPDQPEHSILSKETSELFQQMSNAVLDLHRQVILEVLRHGRR